MAEKKKDISIVDDNWKGPEIGDLVFSHPVGNYPVRRNAGFELHLNRLFFEIARRIYGKRKHDFYGEEYENEVFAVRRYCWRDCTCGFDEKVIEWELTYDHEEHCYQKLVEKELIKRGWRKIDSGYLEPPRDIDFSIYFAIENEVREKYCKELGLSFPEGAAVHCTCSYEAGLWDFIRNHGHSENCAVMLPNFHYKPEDFKIWWYKYPLRDAYCNKNITLWMFAVIIDSCIDSLKKKPASGGEDT